MINLPSLHKNLTDSIYSCLYLWLMVYFICLFNSGTIKRMLEMQIGLPMDQQSLLGWPHHLQISDEVRFIPVLKYTKMAFFLSNLHVVKRQVTNLSCNHHLLSRYVSSALSQYQAFVEHSHYIYPLHPYISMHILLTVHHTFLRCWQGE